MSAHRSSQTHARSRHGKAIPANEDRKALREQERQRRLEIADLGGGGSGGGDDKKPSMPPANLFPSGPPQRAIENDPLTDHLKTCLGEFVETYKQMSLCRSELIGVAHAPATPVDQLNGGAPFEFVKTPNDTTRPTMTTQKRSFATEERSRSERTTPMQKKVAAPPGKIRLPPRGLTEFYQQKDGPDSIDSKKVENILMEMTSNTLSEPLTDTGLSTPLKDPNQLRFDFTKEAAAKKLLSTKEPEAGTISEKPAPLPERQANSDSLDSSDDEDGGNAAKKKADVTCEKIPPNALNDLTEFSSDDSSSSSSDSDSDSNSDSDSDSDDDDDDDDAEEEEEENKIAKVPQEQEKEEPNVEELQNSSASATVKDAQSTENCAVSLLEEKEKDDEISAIMTAVGLADDAPAPVEVMSDLESSDDDEKNDLVIDVPEVEQPPPPPPVPTPVPPPSRCEEEEKEEKKKTNLVASLIIRIPLHKLTRVPESSKRKRPRNAELLQKSDAKRAKPNAKVNNRRDSQANSTRDDEKEPYQISEVSSTTCVDAAAAAAAAATGKSSTTTTTTTSAPTAHPPPAADIGVDDEETSWSSREKISKRSGRNRDQGEDRRDLRIPSHEYHLNEARALKHKADATSHKLTKALLYIKSAIRFIQCGNAMEADLQSDPRGVHDMYQQTIALIQFVLQPYVHGSEKRRGLDVIHQNKTLAVLCLRCLSVLNMKLFTLKRESAVRRQKVLQDHFQKTLKMHAAQPQQVSSPWNPSSGNNAGSPATTTSPASVGSVGSSGSGTEQGKGGSGTAGAAVAAQKPSAHTTKSGHSLQVSPSNPNRSNVTIPHNVAQMTLQHFTVMNFILKSQQLWTQSEEMERSCNGFFVALDEKVKLSLSPLSSIYSLIDWMKCGVSWFSDSGYTSL
ncbi:AF4/FMR2 family member 3-like [Oscarella lobularis]|uniref:AF4/FMR2 family member 3-like n=1 Tax=Oscarella lobularis TaxID=121494 RepID=UPI003313B6C0